MNTGALSLLSFAGLGLVLGLRHALEADHVVAVSALVSQSRGLGRASVIGLSWGLGHTATVVLAGLLLIGLKISVPAKLALGFEFLVGLLIVLLGLDVLFRLRRSHRHLHRHGPVEHDHRHQHVHSPNHSHVHRSFAVGVAHGLAGSGAIAALIAASAASLGQAAAFLLVFGFGTIAGMLGMSLLIGAPFLVARRLPYVQTAVQGLAGSASVAFGILFLVGVGRLLFS